jgi:protein-S-isoprenylcysteine O-methyltransferase Ste14
MRLRVNVFLPAYRTYPKTVTRTAKAIMKKSAAKTSTTVTARDRWIDIGIRIVLGLFFAFSAGIYCKNAAAVLRGIDLAQSDVTTMVHGLSIFAAGLYTLMIACLYVLRLRPVNKFAGWWPSFASIFGGFLMFGLVWFKPRMDLPLAAQLAASILVFTGNILSAYIVCKLGRSFSILPESRKLVMTGPYKIVRHPLYVAEAIASLGTMILFLSVGSIVLVVAQTILQLVRIHYEERVLSENFPDYKAYAKKTARLIPGIY